VIIKSFFLDNDVAIIIMYKIRIIYFMSKIV